MPSVYEFYKPLRNYLRKTELTSSLGVIRAYANHLQFESSFPSDVEVLPGFLSATERPSKGIYEWELEILSREVIINSQLTQTSAPEHDLRRWKYFAGAINKIKEFTNNVSGLSPKDRILRELIRIAHQQFPWQSPQDKLRIGRYFRIFSHSELDRIMQNVFGLTTKEIYIIGFALLGQYLDHIGLNYPPQIAIPGLNLEKLDHFLKRFSLDISDLKTRMLDLQIFNEDYEYSFNPLRAFPLIRMKLNTVDCIVCPIPSLLIRRFTDGAYYEIFDQPTFDRFFGESYQNYVGDVLRRAVGKGNFNIIPEREYHIGPNRNQFSNVTTKG